MASNLVERLRRLKRRARRRQVTCLCPAYSYPHRCTGGRRPATDWAASYLEHEHHECKDCTNYTHAGECDVAVGGERIFYCPGYREHLRNQEKAKHPVVVEQVPFDWPVLAEETAVYCPF